MEIKVMRNIMDVNDRLADENKVYFAEKEIAAVNVMASPGAGKTSVIMKIIGMLREKVNFSVIEGDIASCIDAEKIEKEGIPVVQINTGGGCHLDANMIKEVVRERADFDNTIMFIENVGNLVCPSAFNLGENIRLVIASVPEGHDKPYKYPAMFEGANIIILNKVDIMPYIEFDREDFYKGVRAVNANAPVFEVSCRTGEGMDKLAEWFGSLKQDR